MSIQKRVSPGRPLVLGTVLLAVTALFLTWGHRVSGDVAAQVPAPGLDFSMAVSGVAGCDTTEGDAKCFLDPGSSFTVEFYLNSLPDGATGYQGYDAYVTYTGVVSQDNLTTDEWPDCGFPAQFSPPGGQAIRWTCVVGVDVPPSAYTGLISTLGFECTDEESTDNTINLVHGETDTSINAVRGEVPLGQAAEGAGTLETLTINCGEPPPPTEPPAGETPGATATALPTTGDATGLSEGDGGSTGLWVTIVVLLAAAVSAVGLFGWRYARSR